MTIKLKYIGKMVVPGCAEDFRLWNVDAPWLVWHKSSRTVAGLKELKIIKGDN